MKYAWIHEYRDQNPVARSCDVLGVTRSGYYQWQQRHQRPSVRAQENAQLLVELQTRHRHHRQCYGSPHMTADLRAAGWQVNRKRIARLMRQAGLRARGRCRRRYTTQSAHPHPVAPNRVAQQFTVTAPNRVWVTDITYGATDEGWLYVALVMDLFSRKFVGWAVEAFVDTRLTLAAFQMALGRRQPAATLVHHSDRGVQYAAAAYSTVLEERGMTRSMSRKGNCYDNAPMESANGTLKTECVYAQRYVTRAQAKADLIEYIGYYNTERRHSALGYQSPAAFERQWQSQHQPVETPSTADQGEA
ncbi:MAG: transposase [Nitrospirales bacterium]|nr:MAG: transposase [Nitrospirales bacterium]